MTDVPLAKTSASQPDHPPPVTTPVSSPWAPPRVGILGGTIAIIIGLGGALAILAAWKLPPFATAVEGTEDAYVRGRTTAISPQVSGYVVKVRAQDYQHVKENDVLVEIDDRTYRQKADEAKAMVDVALANLANNAQAVASKRAAVRSAIAAVSSAKAQQNRANLDLARTQKLLKEGPGTQSQLDTANATMESADAAVEQAEASVATANEDVKSAEVQGGVLSALVESAKAQQEQAEIDLSHTRIIAPESGHLSDIGVRLGQYVTNGSQLFFLVPASRWVVGNFKELQTARMAPGQAAWFTVDALDRRRFKGRVEQISPAAGSEFSILRPDNATGNFTKIPQRIPVRIALDPDQAGSERLRPGMSVEAYVDTAGFEEETGSIGSRDAKQSGSQ